MHRVGSVKRSVKGWLKATLVAAIVAAGAVAHGWDDTVIIYKDCFKIIDYSANKHVQCAIAGLEGIDYAVDRFESNDWLVVTHCSGVADSRIAKSAAEEHYVSDSMPAGVVEVAGTRQPFVFEFCVRYADEVLGRTLWYGYVSLGLNEDADLVILESAICNTQNVLLVTENGLSGDKFGWTVIDHGDSVEIDYQKRVVIMPTGKVVIPAEIGGKSVTAIGDYAFCNRLEITSVEIPEAVSSIGHRAFASCQNLTTCNIPASVTNIELQAFMDTGLVEVDIPPGVEYIGCEAFWGCPNLSRLSMWPWTEAEWPLFNSQCKVERTGTVANFVGFAEDCGCDVTNLIAWIGREHFEGVTEFRVYDDYGTMYGNDYWTSKMLYYTGIAPGVVAKNGHVLEAKYTLPELEIVSFDLATRQITGKVVPQGGCHIAAKPEMPFQLGIRRYGSIDSDGVINWSVSPDVSGYADDQTLGEFTHTISEDDFATNNFFRLELIDW